MNNKNGGDDLERDYERFVFAPFYFIPHNNPFV
jgi:hypothetical protein